MKAYLDIVEDIISAPDDAWKGNRTGVRAKSISGTMFAHDMRTGFPLLTTKKMAFKMIAVELEFFIKGLSDKNWLKERGCHLWDEWCNPQKVPYGTDDETKARMAAENDLGRIYGVQWRDFNSVDQLGLLVEKLKSNPADRRMIVSAWNPAELDQMALPPCHLMFQVIVTGENFNVINLNWYQRSVDTMLGLPFNIASYAMLLILLGKEAGMTPGRLCGMLGDTHIYENQFETAKIQLEREPLPLPQLEITDFASIFDWTYKQRRLLNYKSHEKLSYPIAV